MRKEEIMKRFLSWLTLVVGYLIYELVIVLDLFFITYLLSLYDELSAFLKIIVIILGGSFALGLIIYPIIYGATFTVEFSESLYESKKGTRYILSGILILIITILDIIDDFSVKYIFILIFGIILIYFGIEKYKIFKTLKLLGKNLNTSKKRKSISEGEKIKTIYKCPDCGKRVKHGADNCQKCGCNLDWSDDDD